MRTTLVLDAELDRSRTGAQRHSRENRRRARRAARARRARERQTARGARRFRSPRRGAAATPAVEVVALLVDTSVWIDHFRRPNRDLEQLLDEGRVVTHPFVIGELACGSLHHRAEVLRLLDALPAAPLAAHDEVLMFVERQRSGRKRARLDRRPPARQRPADAPFVVERRPSPARRRGPHRPGRPGMTGYAGQIVPRTRTALPPSTCAICASV